MISKSELELILSKFVNLTKYLFLRSIILLRFINTLDLTKNIIKIQKKMRKILN